MTIFLLLPWQLARTADAIAGIAVVPWSAGVLRVRVMAESHQVYPLALEACDASLERADGHEARVSLRQDGRYSNRWRRYTVRFHDMKDLPRVRFRGGLAWHSTVLALDLSCPVTGASPLPQRRAGAGVTSTPRMPIDPAELRCLMERSDDPQDVADEVARLLASVAQRATPRSEVFHAAMEFAQRCRARGDTAREQGSLRVAIEPRFVREDGFARAVLRLVELLEAETHWRDAIMFAQRLEGLIPRREYYELRGRLCARGGDPSQAEGWLQKASREDV